MAHGNVDLRSAEERLISRRALLDHLHTTEARSVLVIGPAGVGKTTILKQWGGQLDSDCCWLPLESSANRLSAFVGQFVQALTPICPSIAHATTISVESGNDQPIRPADHALMDALQRCELRWNLIVDNYDVISHPDIHNFMARVIRSMPATGRLVIACRAEPPLAIARLRVQGHLDLVEASAFRLTSAECAAMFQLQDVSITEEQAGQIAKSTGGWTVAVRLAAIAARNSSVDDVFVRLEDGNDLALLSDYLLQEVLNQFPDDLRAFVLQLSILERFTLETCHEVIEGETTGYLFDQVRRSGLLVHETDGSRSWFEFYGLLRGLLRRELALAFSPVHIRRLHDAASTWYRDAGYVDEAVGHALIARNWSVAAEALILTAPRMFVTNRLEQLITWLDAFPAKFILEDPDLSSMYAYALIRTGRIDDAMAFVYAAEDAWRREGNDGGLALVEMVRAAIARFREDGFGIVEHAGRALQLASKNFDPRRLHDMTVGDASDADFTDTWVSGLPLDSSSQNFMTAVRMTPQVQMLYGLCLIGRVGEAERLAEEKFRWVRSEGFRLPQRMTAAVLGIARLLAAELVEADETLEPIAKFDLLDVPPEIATAIWARAQVFYEWNRLDEAERLIIQGNRMLERVSASWQNSPLLYELARIQHARGDIEGTLETLDEAAVSAWQIQNIHRRRLIDAFRARISIDEGSFESAARWANAVDFPEDVRNPHYLVDEYLVNARLLIATGDSKQAAAMLERLRPVMAERGSWYDLIRILTLLGLTYIDQFELDQAVEVLHEALNRSAENGFMRVFIDEGPAMLRLLRIVYRRGIHVPYITSLIEASGETPDEVTRVVHDEIVEPITARELDVLKLAALGLTNKQIAGELFLAVATIKRHITNINGKLEVDGRFSAVRKARLLGLLANQGDDAAYQSHSG